MREPPGMSSRSSASLNSMPGRSATNCLSTVHTMSFALHSGRRDVVAAPIVPICRDRVGEELAHRGEGFARAPVPQGEGEPLAGLIGRELMRPEIDLELQSLEPISTVRSMAPSTLASTAERRGLPNRAGGRERQHPLTSASSRAFSSGYCCACAPLSSPPRGRGARGTGRNLRWRPPPPAHFRFAMFTTYGCVSTT